MSDDDTGILLSSTRQADLLRRRAAGNLPNEIAPDWPNRAEEIESVGHEQLHAVASLLMRALVHMRKIAAWPASRAVSHWQVEMRLFKADATRRYAPSVRQRIDLPALYRQARRGLPDHIDGQPPLPVPEQCSVTPEELLADE